MTKNKPRIAIFTHNYPVNSRERKDAGIFVYDFAHELTKHAKVFIFCSDFGGDKENYKDVPVTWLNWKGPKIKFGNWPIYSPISVFNFFKLMYFGCRESEKFVKKNKIDYCLAAWVVPSAMFALWVKIRIGTPYFVWILGSDVNKYTKLPVLKQFSIAALKQAKARFANSYWLIGIVEKLSGKSCNYMDAITNFSVSKAKPEKLKQDKYNFLFVGRLEKVKGPDVLVKACNELKRVRPDFVLHVLGDGSMRKFLEGLVEKYKLTKNVKFYGNADKEKVAAFMKAADCLMVTSRTESIPLVMVEAARVGLATVSTDVGDCKRVIKKYDIGFVAKNEDSHSIAKAMVRVMGEGKLFKKRRQKGLAHLSKSRSQKVAVRTLLSQIYEKNV